MVRKVSGMMKTNLKTPEYQSGACNIGGPEVRRRKISAIIGAVFSLAFYVVAFSLDASRGIRAMIFFPLMVATVGWFQSRRKFCVVYGMRGFANFGQLGEGLQVIGSAEKSADRVQAVKIFAQAALLAAVISLVTTLVPA